MQLFDALINLETLVLNSVTPPFLFWDENLYGYIKPTLHSVYINTLDWLFQNWNKWLFLCLLYVLEEGNVLMNFKLLQIKTESAFYHKTSGQMYTFN